MVHRFEIHAKHMTIYEIGGKKYMLSPIKFIGPSPLLPLPSLVSMYVLS